MKAFISKFLFLSLLLAICFTAEAKKPVSKISPKHVGAKTQGQGSAPTTAHARPGKTEEGDFVIEQRGDGSKVKYKKKTSYDFEGANIDGMYNKPSGSYISNIKDVKAKSIIRVRENFDAEVVDSERLLK